MDKKLATLISNEAIAALEAVAAKHGMTVRSHGGQVGDIDAVLKFQFKVADKGALAAAEKAEFERYAYAFGLEPTDYHAAFAANGKTYTLVAFDLKRRKFPILAEDATGKRVCFTDMVVDRVIQNRGGAATGGMAKLSRRG